MSLTQRERDIVDLLRAQPLLDAAGPRRTPRHHQGRRVGAPLQPHQEGRDPRPGIRRPARSRSPSSSSAAPTWTSRRTRPTRSSCAPPTPGAAITTPGGVGRNIAENLARLGSPTHLVAPVGSDAFGEQVTGDDPRAGVTVDHLIAIGRRDRHLPRGARRHR